MAPTRTPSGAPDFPRERAHRLGRLATLGLAAWALVSQAEPGTPYTDGPPPGHTGGFNEPTCRACHSDNPLNQDEGALELSGAPDVYTPGQSYTLTVELTRPGLRTAGFQLAARHGEGDRAGLQAGELRAIDEWVQVIEGIESAISYAQHTGGGTSLVADTVRWSIEWRAPDRPGGAVIFDVAANASNDDASEFGDFIYATSRGSRIQGQSSERWIVQASGTSSEFRGLSAASEKVVWAGARNGIYARTVDGGTTWHADTVPGAASLFFIDVHAVDASTAYLLGTDFDGGLAAIYKTTDGGSTWLAQYRNEHPDVFFDGMAFWDADNGVAFGDPVEGSLMIVTTDDGWATWNRVPPENIPPPLSGEAGFAASGTAITVQGMDSVWIGTGGGRVARVYRSVDRGRTWSAAETPLPGGQTAGIFGIAFRDALNGVAVGGDYTRRYEAAENVIRTDDGGLTWRVAGRAQPFGVRYGVAYVPGEVRELVASGPSGWGHSLDDGATWVAIDTVSHNTTAAAGPEAVWVAGIEGRIAVRRRRSGR